MRCVGSFILLQLVLLALVPLSYAEERNALFLYGRHSDFWDEVESLEDSQSPENQALKFLNKKEYGALEGIAKAEFELLSKNESFWDGAFDTSSFGISVNGLAGGEIYNRISPHLRGYATWDVALSSGLSRKIPKISESGWDWLVGGDVGIGRQKIVQGAVIDFVNKTPIRDATFYYFGLNLELGYTSQFSDYMRFHYKALFLPTFFYAPLDDPQFANYGVKNKSTQLRWRTEFEQSYAFQAPTEGGFEMGWQTFGGQQPTPVRVLPRVWDSIHDLKFFPSIGSLLGLGGVARVYNGTREWGLTALGGYYGGYFGGGASLQAYWFNLEAGTYGYEQTSQFQVRESRVQYASLGFHYEW